MLDVVRIIIERRHHSGIFVSLEEQSLMVKIREADRSVESVHTAFFSPSRHGIQQRLADLHIINEVEPAETDMSESPFLVRFAVDDTGDTSDGFVIAERHP